METTTSLSSITPHFDNLFDTMHSSPQSPDFLKLEDLDASNSSEFATQTATPPPVIVQSRPAKKRKSWGQRLPEPTTTLPPRKRAKTDDEKEQRRIERIKRNRAAAHNSRERKRQEAEVLAVENARLRAKIDALEKHYGPLPKHIILPDVTLQIEDVDTPAPSLIESRGSIGTAPTPASPPDLYDYTNSTVEIKQEPHDSPFSDLHPSFDALDSKHPSMPSLAPLDATQHSAEMLCDLPCPSSRSRGASFSSSTSSSTPPNWISATAQIMTALNLSYLLTYQAILTAMWTPSPSRPARATSASPRVSTSPSTTSSTPTASRMPRSSSATTALAQRNAATAVTARFAALRRPLVGEARRTTDSMAVAAVDDTRRRLDGATRTMALGLEEQREQTRDDDSGVGREDTSLAS